MENEYQEGPDQTNARPQIIHLKTTIQTTFAVLDGGNVIKEIPVQIQVERLDPALFAKAAETIHCHAIKLQAELDGKTA